MEQKISYYVASYYPTLQWFALVNRLTYSDFFLSIKYVTSDMSYMLQFVICHTEKENVADAADVVCVNFQAKNTIFLSLNVGTQI